MSKAPHDDIDESELVVSHPEDHAAVPRPWRSA